MAGRFRVPTSNCGRRRRLLSEAVLVGLWLDGCTTTSAQPTDGPTATKNTPRESTPPSPTATYDPSRWQELPVVPAVSETARAIYRRGLERGNNPRAFSKIGDCESTPTWFLGDFDRQPPLYRLGDFDYLEAVIQQFTGSFLRTSLAAGRGWNASTVLTPLWADPSQCVSAESPLDCELRQHQPSLAFVMLGTNDRWRQESFEGSLRRILETLIERGVVPILATKADNPEGDGSLNTTITRLALEYDVPLWNYWLAVQPLPGHGLQQDGAHITWDHNYFDDPRALQAGWPVRNLTALQALDAVWRGVNGETLRTP
ncbi:MAG: SGNH/GDSL hydrolase family protein [Chloroflexota bacterium]